MDYSGVFNHHSSMSSLSSSITASYELNQHLKEMIAALPNSSDPNFLTQAAELYALLLKAQAGEEEFSHCGLAELKNLASVALEDLESVLSSIKSKIKAPDGKNVSLYLLDENGKKGKPVTAWDLISNPEAEVMFEFSAGESTWDDLDASKHGPVPWYDGNFGHDADSIKDDPGSGSMDTIDTDNGGYIHIDYKIKMKDVGKDTVVMVRDSIKFTATSTLSTLVDYGFVSGTIPSNAFSNLSKLL